MAQELGPLFTVITTFASAAVTSAGLGVWIMKQFDNQRQDFYRALDAQRQAFADKIDEHEKVDADRHIDNLGRFADIRVALTRMGQDVPFTYQPPKS